RAEAQVPRRCGPPLLRRHDPRRDRRRARRTRGNGRLTSGDGNEPDAEDAGPGRAGADRRAERGRGGLMDSHHPQRNPMEPDWSGLIRTELETHNPRRLPARFTPRLVPEAPARRRWARPLAVAVAVLLLAAAV